MNELLPALHLSATAMMTGVIWVVQLIQYPWFHRCPPDQFVAYHHQYTARIGFIVGPTMLIEAATGILLYLHYDGYARDLMQSSLLVLLAIWISTAIRQIPDHRLLSHGYNETTHQRLVKLNWIRTVGWSLRLVLVIAASAAHA
jgi:hypothetical protein